MIEGEMAIVVEGESRVLKTGESINLPPGILHTFGNQSASPCKWLNIHSPKGFLRFFLSRGVPTRVEQGAEAPVTPDLVERVIREAGECDMPNEVSKPA